MVNTPAFPSSAPWLQDFQAKSLSLYESLDWPKRTDENWRFGNLKRAQLDQFEPTEDTPEIQAPEGVQILPLEEVPQDRIIPLLEGLQGLLGSEKYVALAHAKRFAGTCVLVPKGVELTEPVIITHTVRAALAPVTLILAEDNSQVTVFERFVSGGEHPQLVIGSTSVLAETGSRVTYCLSQELNATAHHIQASHALTGRDASLQMATANFGGEWIRQECVAELHHSGGNCEVLGLNLGTDKQEIDQRTLQHHFAGQTRSDLLYKNALFGASKAIFSGLIQVDEGAHYTDAFQSCRNLMLSNEAEANAMPGLEINADQVKCSHGATSSRIDPEELFYLEARGIPEAKARLLVTFGFANEVIQQIRNEGVQSKLTELLETKLQELSALSDSV